MGAYSGWMKISPLVNFTAGSLWPSLLCLLVTPNSSIIQAFYFSTIEKGKRKKKQKKSLLDEMIEAIHKKQLKQMD
jgi:hypothetical protein